jgi:hypothetical protein
MKAGQDMPHNRSICQKTTLPITRYDPIFQGFAGEGQRGIMKVVQDMTP